MCVSLTRPADPAFGGDHRGCTRRGTDLPEPVVLDRSGTGWVDATRRVVRAIWRGATS
jgi:hypothetical protein